jgi:hypothetical protein
MNTLRYVIAFVLGIVLPLLVQRWDRGRRFTPPPPAKSALGRLWNRLIAATFMSKEQRRGAWNCASWGAALYAFGPLSMIGWVWVAHHDLRRWRARGLGIAIGKSVLLLLLGVLAAVLVSSTILLADALIAEALGLPE